ncbi:MAG: NAD(P)/FAD-dependent oxidoreductase [Dehalococcoidia bacterium]|nr:NAD(P)/FAD-dependent oxidoreductase [Dehalococcoidia bacterium]
MRYDCDVVVAGAGPAGAVAARDIARRGFRVMLLEEHAQVGAPVHCSGLVTPRTLEAAGVAEQAVVVNRIKGAIVHSPLGKQVVVGGDKVRALVMDRQRFDELLAKQAQNAGAELVLSARVAGVTADDEQVTVRVEQEGRSRTISARIVIGADGSHSTVGRSLGLARPGESIAAIGGEMTAHPLAEDMVEVFVEPDLTPGWFGWLIPLGSNGAVRIGIGIGARTHSPRRILGTLVERHAHLRDGKFLRLQGGLIPVDPPKRITANRGMLVGDASGSVKPTSGGGIYTGIRSAQLAACTAASALESGRCAAEDLAPYDITWSAQVRGELLLGKALRHMLMRLTPKQIDAMLGLLSVPELQAVALERGDIDFPARLFTGLLGNRAVLRALVSLSPRAWAPLASLAWRWQRERARLGAASRPG